MSIVENLLNNETTGTADTLDNQDFDLEEEFDDYFEVGEWEPVYPVLDDEIYFENKVR